MGLTEAELQKLDLLLEHDSKLALRDFVRHVSTMKQSVNEIPNKFIAPSACINEVSLQ